VIVLYDGDCGFCRWMVAWALERDRYRVMEVAPIQSPTGERLLAGLEPAERLRTVHVVRDDGRRTSGGAAAREVLEVTARPLARLAAFSPRATDLVYRLVAGQRSRLSRLVPRRAKLRADRMLGATPAPRSGTPAGSPRTGGGGPPRRGGSP
jgi:predicted DCC family thiol-disulfide oxidoreductase YuxK